MISFLFQFILRTFVVLIFCFTLLHFLPGSPFQDSEIINQKVFENLSQHYRTSGQSSFLSQLVVFSKNFLTFDFGNSLLSPQQNVLQVIYWSFLSTGVLFLGTLLALLVLSQVAFFLTIYFGLEKRMNQICSFMISIPVIVIVPLFIYFFGFYWHFSLIQNEKWSSWVLPIMALTFRPLFLFLKWQLDALKNEGARPWFRFFQALGFSKFQLFSKWAYPQTWTPIISYMPGFMVFLLMGSVFVETMFQIPGLGYLFLQSLFLRDSMTLMVLFYLTSLFYFLLQGFWTQVLKSSPKDVY